MRHKVLLTTPRFFAFEAMIREHLGEHGCEVLEHQAHDMQMKEETLLTLVPEAAGMITALEPVTASSPTSPTSTPSYARRPT